MQLDIILVVVAAFVRVADVDRLLFLLLIGLLAHGRLSLPQTCLRVQIFLFNRPPRALRQRVVDEDVSQLDRQNRLANPEQTLLWWNGKECEQV